MERGGYSSVEFRSGIKWMYLGDNTFSSVACHVAQVGWGFSREEILSCAEQFGEVVAFHLEIKKKGD
eukprot:3139403-Karenia_brevis.AAC.1